MDTSTIIRFLISLFIGISVFLFVYQIIPRSRKKWIDLKDAEEAREETSLGRIKPLFRLIIAVEKKIRPIASIIDRYSPEYTKKLIMAGSPGNLKGEDFIGLKQFTAIAALILPYVFEIDLWWAILFALLFGFVMPDLWLSEQIRNRHLKIARALPDVLDLLTFSVEAGMDFISSVRTIVEKSRPNPLIEELYFALQEIEFGRTRRQALEDMAKRVELQSLSSFVLALIQADQMGAPLGPTLRVQAEELRNRRFQRAEELAQKAPVKMLAPLIIFIFPSVFVILLGPIVLRMMGYK